ncbi:hypothetical protein GF318_04745, partial [Candidatus Micrarchaeota archaeon]|nr:hypothetical protein [Candidatus Micrarchaeota archaeon]
MRCLREIKRTNKIAAERQSVAKDRGKGSVLKEVPDAIACNPVLVRRFVNRPWTA